MIGERARGLIRLARALIGQRCQAHPKTAGEIVQDRRPPAVRGEELALAGGKKGGAPDHTNVHLLVLPVLAPFPDIAAHVIKSESIGWITSHRSRVGESIIAISPSPIRRLIPISASTNAVGIIARVGRRRPLGSPGKDFA